MSSALPKTLVQLGLSENEAKVYLAALSLGPTSVQKVASASKVRRTSVYPVLESLVSRGLVSMDVHGLKRRIVAAPPARLETIIDTQRSLIRSILPELEGMYRLDAGEGAIKCFEGLAGVRRAYRDLLDGTKPGDEYLICTELVRWSAVDPAFFDEFVKKRERRLLDVRILATDTPKAREIRKAAGAHRGQIKILPQDACLDVNMVVVPQRVLIHEVRSQISAVVLFNKSIIQMHRQFFEMLWRMI